MREALEQAGLAALLPFLASLGIGLMMGLERERNPAAKAGLRTFALLGITGTAAALLDQQTGGAWLLPAGLLAVGLMTALAYQRDGNPGADPGTTTVAAALLCYLLGALTWHGHATLAVMVAVASTLLLHFKPELAGMSRGLTRADLTSILQFAVLTFVILPILPNRDLGPYDAVNPRQAWLMVVLISGLSLAGYLALRLLGGRYGAPLLGVMGGLVSSTATTLVYARQAQSGEAAMRLALVVVLLANLTVLLRLGVVTAVAAPAVLPALLPVLGGGLVLGGAATLAGWRRIAREGETLMPEIGNPTELSTALGFGLLYAGVLMASAWLSDLAGSGGLYLVALVSGLTDVDAITLSSLRLVGLGRLEAPQAAGAVAIAFLSNLAFKYGLVLTVGGRRLAILAAPGFAGIALGVGAAALLA